MGMLEKELAALEALEAAQRAVKLARAKGVTTGRRGDDWHKLMMAAAKAMAEAEAALSKGTSQ